MKGSACVLALACLALARGAAADTPPVPGVAPSPPFVSTSPPPPEQLEVLPPPGVHLAPVPPQLTVTPPGTASTVPADDGPVSVRFASGITGGGVPFTSYDLFQWRLRLPYLRTRLATLGLGGYVRGRESLSTVEGGPCLTLSPGKSKLFVGVGFPGRQAWRARRPEAEFLVGFRCKL